MGKLGSCRGALTAMKEDLNTLSTLSRAADCRFMNFDKSRQPALIDIHITLQIISSIGIA